MVTRDLITERWGQQEVAKWLTDNKLGQFVDRYAVHLFVHMLFKVVNVSIHMPVYVKLL